MADPPHASKPELRPLDGDMRGIIAGLRKITASDAPLVRLEPLCDRDAVSRAALDRLPWVAPWAYYDPTPREVTEARRRIELTRAWAEKLTDACAKEAYLRWMKHAERFLEEELLREEKQRRANAVNIPSPPNF